VSAKIKLNNTSSGSGEAKTGIMTIWKKINIEYVKMKTADSLPVNDIPKAFEKAFVEMNIEKYREEPDRFFNIGTASQSLWVMGLNDKDAEYAENKYCTREYGEFTKQGPGWFFLASAHEQTPKTSGISKVIYPSSGTAGEAIANKDTIIIPTPIASGEVPDIVYVYNSTLTKKVLFQAIPKSLSSDRKSFKIYKKNYQYVDIPEQQLSFLNADLKDYGFAEGASIKVKVKTAGAYGTAGRSPGLAAKSIIYTGFINAATSQGTIIHELTHALSFAHKCGNWDYSSSGSKTSCVMNYDSYFILDNDFPRKPIQWTNNKTSTSNLCARHIEAIRKYNLEEDDDLGW
jgi:hypothetical protein